MSTTSCAVVGVGVLGTSLCRQILESLGDYTVTGITQSTRRHEEIRQQVRATQDRFRLVTLEELPPEEKFDNVVFCAPPSGFEDYPAAVKQAAENLWAGADKGGVFAFTSSGAVYVK